MRQTLIRVLLDEPWTLWQTDKMTGLDGMGICTLLLLGGLVAIGISWWRWGRSANGEERSVGSFVSALRGMIAAWIGLLVILTFLAPHWATLLPQAQFEQGGPLIPRTSYPIWGYGFMLLIGFLAALKFAERRATAAGISRDQLFDLGFWMLICGIGGARLFYLLQYGDKVFQNARGPIEHVKAALDLSKGGIVLYGGMIGAAAAYFVFCHRRQISPLALADVLTPSAMIALGFGRIGCLLNGCCYGDRCELPWAIQFPRESLTWNVLVNEGFLDPASPLTMPLHPTQIYSSINAFLLAWLTAMYYRHRRQNGEVFALALIVYPLTRFTIEFIRGDEMGQFGTGFTISQIVSMVIFAIGVALVGWLTFGPAHSRLPTSLRRDASSVQC